MERERSPPRIGEQARVFCPWVPCWQAPCRSWMGVPCSHAAPLGRPCRWNLAGGDPRSLLCRPQLGPLSGMWPLLAARFNWAYARCRPDLLRRQQLLATVVALLWPPFFWQTSRYFGMCPIVAPASWAQCLARALPAVAHHNSAEAWWDLLMLPKAVLRPAPRGGALRRQQARQFTLHRCGRRLGGEREELLEAHARPRGRRASHAPEDSEDPVVRARHSRC